MSKTQHAEAIITLFGRSNRFSKLPYTLLAEAFTAESAFLDMNMTDPPGRTYKYYTGNNTIRPFGFGLSYTTFSLAFEASSRFDGEGTAKLELPDSTVRKITHGPRPVRQLRGADVVLTDAGVVVTNTGAVAGDEVVFLFHNASAAHAANSGPADPLAKKQLVAFDRVRLDPGQSATVHFNVTLRMLSTVGADGRRRVLGGEHGLIVSRGHGAVLSRRVMLSFSGGGRMLLL